MLRPLSCAFALCLAVPALAQDNHCATAVVQMELNQCAYEEWQAADAGLNQAYKEAMAVMKAFDAETTQNVAKGADVLRDAQRAWITFRDLSCEAEGYPMKGGSAEPLLIYGCMRVLTERRAEDLRGLVDAFGG